MVAVSRETTCWKEVEEDRTSVHHVSPQDTTKPWKGTRNDLGALRGKACTVFGHAMDEVYDSERVTSTSTPASMDIEVW